jgi:hypothetical protein
MEIDDALARRVQNVEADGKRRYGDDAWQNYMAAIHRANPRGIDPGVVQATLNTPDPASAFATAGRECLIREASDGDAEAEATYSKIREEERRSYRERKGRR